MKANIYFFIILLFCFFQKSFSLISRYTNPVISQDAPDPSVIRGDNGYFYLYATGERIFKSLDLVNWEYVRNVFEGSQRKHFQVSCYLQPQKRRSLWNAFFAGSYLNGSEVPVLPVSI